MTYAFRIGKYIYAIVNAAEMASPSCRKKVARDKRKDNLGLGTIYKLVNPAN